MCGVRRLENPDRPQGETLLILQTGSTLVLSVSGFKSAGVVYADDKKPDQKGQVGFVECSTTTVPDSSATNQVGRLVAKTKPGSPKASVSWSSTFENANLAGTCKGSYKRVDTTPPALSGCS